jgi:type II secretory pathway pseudopilin PulG
MEKRAVMERTKTLPVGEGPGSRQKGFTYLILLAMIVVLGIMAGAASTLVSYEARAEAEKELMFRGLAYRNAIRSYYRSSKTIKRFPSNLDDLLKDPRYLQRQHIRRLYKDPLTNDDWEVIRDGYGGIIGVYSRSDKEPMKKAFFPAGLEDFEKAKIYSDWKFEYKPDLKKKITNDAASVKTEI